MSESNESYPLNPYYHLSMEVDEETGEVFFQKPTLPSDPPSRCRSRSRSKLRSKSRSKSKSPEPPGVEDEKNDPYTPAVRREIAKFVPRSYPSIQKALIEKIINYSAI